MSDPLSQPNPFLLPPQQQPRRAAETPAQQIQRANQTVEQGYGPVVISDLPLANEPAPPPTSLPAAASPQTPAMSSGGASGGLAFGPPDLSRTGGQLPTVVQLEQRVGQVVSAAANAGAAVSASLTTCTILTGSAFDECKRAIYNRLTTQIEYIKSLCQGSIDCVTQQLANAQAEAASLAAQGGCPQAIANETAGQVVNRLRQEGPAGLSQWWNDPTNSVCPRDTIPEPVLNPFTWRPDGQTAPPSLQPPRQPQQQPQQPLQPPQQPQQQQPSQQPQPSPYSQPGGGNSPAGVPLVPPAAPLQTAGAQPFAPPGVTADQCANLGPPPPPGPVGIMVPDAAIQAASQGPPVSVAIPACGGPSSLGASGPGGGQGTLVYFPATGQGFLTVGNHAIPYGIPAATVANANWYYTNCLCLLAGFPVGGGGGPLPPLPPQPPPTQCPPPPTCPVCQKPGCDCGCYDQCHKKQKKPTTKWYVYKRADGSCYVVEQETPTEIEGDELVGDYDNETQAILTAQQCKARNPPPTNPQPDVITNLAGGIWCNLDVCETIAALDAGETIAEIDLPQWLQPALVSGAAYSISTDQTLASLPLAVRLPVGLLRGGLFYLTGWIAAALRGFVCPASGVPEVIYSLNVYRAVVGFLGKFIGGVADDALIEPEQTVHYLCPQRVPTSSEADAAYLSNSISVDQWRCWVRANNDCDVPRETIVDSKRQRIGVNENVALYLRGEIDKETYYSGLRQLGFLNQQQADQYLTLSQQIPPVSELIRMMVRDVADEGLVTQFGMDKHFTDKWVGQLKEWGHNQGIPDLFAQYEWRAHWSIPSPGQLYEMYHRGRTLPPDDPRYIDVPTITTALEQQDILPYWIPKFIGISFKPLTRIDAGRAFEVGVLGKDALHKAYTDQGYDDDNADTLVKFKQRQVAVRLRTLPIVTLYRKKLLNKQQVYNFLVTQNYEPESVSDALNYAKMLSDADTSAKCVASLRKRYMLGEVNQTDLQPLLMQQGLDLEQAISTANAWECERSARGKLAPAAQLCKWFKSGLIGQADYTLRLLNLGWSTDDVAAHLNQCQIEIDAAKLKQQLADQKAKERAAKQLAKEQEQLLKQQQQQAEKMARLALQEAKLSRKQFQNITTAAKWLAKNTGMDWTTAYSIVIDGINYGTQHYKLDWQAAIDAAVKVAYSTKVNDPNAIQMQMQQGQRAEWLAFQTAAIDGSEVL